MYVYCVQRAFAPVCGWFNLGLIKLDEEVGLLALCRLFNGIVQLLAACKAQAAQASITGKLRLRKQGRKLGGGRLQKPGKKGLGFHLV